MRRRIVALAAVSLIVLGASASAVFGRSPGAGGSAPIETKVLDQIAARGSASFWVVLDQKADLRPAYSLGRARRGEYVYEELRATADKSQAGLRALLLSRRAGFRSFWIVNAIRVTGGDSLLHEIANRPEVGAIFATRTYQLPDPPPVPAASVNAIDWGVAVIDAPQVWSTFGDRGENIVVANIDTGVQFDHPALVAQYRGNLGGGSFDHNYNWYDPSNDCGTPSVPCDDEGHGSHTMGTMLGDDGNPGANQIGVAPGARWIAAKACGPGTSCSQTELFAAGQWILAPTNLQGQNPRPDLRPHIVNNSWGGPSGLWYQSIVDAWVASGIFPAFSSGNSGPACGTAGSPGDYANSYSAGSFDVNGNIASSSSRGPSVFGGEKPNIAAPGVFIRSSVPPSSYATASGTSMASPHLAGTVALMWSEAPTLVRNVAATRTLLDDTATDVSDLTCGGTPVDNGVWGEGKLNALAAVTAAVGTAPPPPQPPPPPPPVPPPPPPPPLPPRQRTVVRCRVPKVVGQRLAAAKRRIRAAKCSVGRVKKVRSKRRFRGRVVAQSPRAGAVRARNFPVKVVAGKL